MSINKVSSIAGIQMFVPSQASKSLSELIVALVMKILSALGQQTGKELEQVEMLSPRGETEVNLDVPANCPGQLLNQIIAVLSTQKVNIIEFDKLKGQLPESVQQKYSKNIPSIELPAEERIEAIRQFFVNLLRANS